MVGGVADHLHRMADHLAARTPVTVMTTVPLKGASWTHAYRLVTLDPLPESLLDTAKAVRFSTVSFASAWRVDVRAHMACREAS